MLCQNGIVRCAALCRCIAALLHGSDRANVCELVLRNPLLHIHMPVTLSVFPWSRYQRCRASPTRDTSCTCCRVGLTYWLQPAGGTAWGHDCSCRFRFRIQSSTRRHRARRMNSVALTNVTFCIRGLLLLSASSHMNHRPQPVSGSQHCLSSSLEMARAVLGAVHRGEW